jgi:hypothetical protein
MGRACFLVGKPEAKRPLRDIDGIEVDLKRNRMGWYGLD